MAFFTDNYSSPFSMDQPNLEGERSNGSTRKETPTLSGNVRDYFSGLTSSETTPCLNNRVNPIVIDDFLDNLGEFVPDFETSIDWDSILEEENRPLEELQAQQVTIQQTAQENFPQSETMQWAPIQPINQSVFQQPAPQPYFPHYENQGWMMQAMNPSYTAPQPNSTNWVISQRPMAYHNPQLQLNLQSVEQQLTMVPPLHPLFIPNGSIPLQMQQPFSMTNLPSAHATWQVGGKRKSNSANEYNDEELCQSSKKRRKVKQSQLAPSNMNEVFTDPKQMHQQINTLSLEFINCHFKGKEDEHNSYNEGKQKLTELESRYSVDVYEGVANYKSHLFLKLNAKRIDHFVRRTFPLVQSYVSSPQFTEELWETFCHLFCVNFDFYHMHGAKGKGFAERLKQSLLGCMESWSKGRDPKISPVIHSDQTIETYGKTIKYYQMLIKALDAQNLQTAVKIKAFYAPTPYRLTSANKGKALKEKIKQWIVQKDLMASSSALKSAAELFAQFLRENHVTNCEREVVQELADALSHTSFENADTNEGLMGKANSFTMKSIQEVVKIFAGLTNKLKLKNHILAFDKKIASQLVDIPFSKSLLVRSNTATNEIKKVSLPSDFDKKLSEGKVRLCIGLESVGAGKNLSFNLRYLIAIEGQYKHWEFYPLAGLDSKSYKKAASFFKDEVLRIENVHLNEFKFVAGVLKKKTNEAEHETIIHVHPLFPSSKQLHILSSQNMMEGLLVLKNSVPAHALKHSFLDKEGSNLETRQSEDSDFIYTLTKLASHNIGLIYLGNAFKNALSSSLSIHHLLKNFNKIDGMTFENTDDEEINDDDDEISVEIGEEENVVEPQPIESNEIIIEDRRDASKIFKKSTEASLDALKLRLCPKEKELKAMPVATRRKGKNSKPLSTQKDLRFFNELLMSSMALQEKIEAFIAAIQNKNAIPSLYRPYRNLATYQNEFLIKGIYLQQKNKGILLADDMGLGKTVQSLALLKRLREEDKDSQGKPFLVLAPACAMRNWKADAVNLLGYSEDAVICYHGANRKKIDKNSLSNAAIVLTTYDTFHSDYKDFTKSFKCAGIVMDEAHSCANPNGRKTKNLKAFVQDIEKNRGLRLALTGTAIQNQISDIHHIMELINPGAFGTLVQFNQYYITPLKEANQYIGQSIKIGRIHPAEDEQAIELCRKAAQRLSELKQVIGFCTIYRTKEDPIIVRQIQELMGSDKKVPIKKLKEISFSLSPSQKELYADHIQKNELTIVQYTSRAFFNEQKSKGSRESLVGIEETVRQIKEKKPSYLRLRSQMCQMICHPSLLKMRESESGSKIEETALLENQSFAEKIAKLSIEELAEQSGKIKALVEQTDRLKAKEKAKVEKMWVFIHSFLVGDFITCDEESLANRELLSEFKDWLKGKSFAARVDLANQLQELKKHVGTKPKTYKYNGELKTSSCMNTLLDVWSEFYKTELEKTGKSQLELELLTRIHRLLWRQTEKTLYFTQWLETKAILAKVLGEKYGEQIELYEGKTKSDEREFIVDDFNSTINNTNLALMLKAGGVGINLGTAKNVFILDPWFSPGPINQASDRARRLNSLWPKVKVFRFHASETIEKAIVDLAQIKQKFIDFMFDKDERDAEKWLLNFFIKDSQATLDFQQNLAVDETALEIEEVNSECRAFIGEENVQSKEIERAPLDDDEMFDDGLFIDEREDEWITVPF